MVGQKEVIFKGDVLVTDPLTAFAVLTKGTSGKFLKAGASTVSWEDPTIAKLEDIGDVEAYTGNGNKVLTVNAGGTDVEWTVAGTGDLKADGSVPMTAAFDFDDNAAKDMKLYTTVPAVPADGHIYFDSPVILVFPYFISIVLCVS